jgi:hypothetical protein
MEEIDRMALTDPDVVPEPHILEQVLGESHPAYEELLRVLQSIGLRHEWRYYGDGKAWLCKVTGKKKTVVWMSAWPGFVRATVYFPERLLDGVFGCGIDPDTIERVRSSRSVGKSRPCTVDVRDSRGVVELQKLIRHKVTIG